MIDKNKEQSKKHDLLIIHYKYGDETYSLYRTYNILLYSYFIISSFLLFLFSFIIFHKKTKKNCLKVNSEIERKYSFIRRRGSFQRIVDDSSKKHHLKQQGKAIFISMLTLEKLILSIENSIVCGVNVKLL